MLGCCAGACGSGLLFAAASVVLSQRDKILGFVGRNYIKLIVFLVAPVSLSMYAVKMGHVEVPQIDIPYANEAAEIVNPFIKEARALIGLEKPKSWADIKAKADDVASTGDAADVDPSSPPSWAESSSGGSECPSVAAARARGEEPSCGCKHR